MRERHPGYVVTVIPIVAGALGGGLTKTISELSKLITKREIVMRTVSEMQKTILMDNESIYGKLCQDSPGSRRRNLICLYMYISVMCN